MGLYPGSGSGSSCSRGRCGTGRHVIRQSLKFSVEDLANFQGNVREKLIYLLDLWKVPPWHCLQVEASLAQKRHHMQIWENEPVLALQSWEKIHFNSRRHSVAHDPAQVLDKA